MNTTDEHAIIEGLRAFTRMLAHEIAAALETSPPEPPPSTAAPGPVSTRPCTDRYVTAQELADTLALPLASVWHHARNGTIPALRLGSAYRFDLAHVIEVLQEKGGNSWR